MPVLVPSPPVPSPDWPATYPAWQLEIGGLILGAATQYQITADGPDGFGLPDLRTSDSPRPQDHGLFFGEDFFSGRTLTFDVWVLGDTPAQATALMDALVAVWRPPSGSDGITPLKLRLPGLDERIMFGRPRRLAYDVSRLRAGTVRASLQYDAADPRIYSSEESTVSAILPIVTGGLVFPTGFPIIWGSGGAGGSALATNLGNFPARPVIILHGQLVAPTLENVTTGRTFRMRDSYALDTGDSLVIDFDARTVLLNGTASRYGDVDSTSQWWELEPGSNQIRLGASAGDGTADITYRSAWL